MLVRPGAIGKIGSSGRRGTPSPAPTPTPPPAGFDAFTYMGDSLIPGRGNFEADRDPVLDAPVADTVQYVNHSSQGDYQQLRFDTSPTWYPDGNGYDTTPTGRVSVNEAVERSYQALTASWNRGVAAIPCGVGGSALLHASSNDWDPATPGTYLVNAKNAHNAAYALLRDAEPGSRMRAIVMDLTSNDVNGGGYNSTNIRAAWLGLIDYVRANFDGVDDETIIVIGGPCAAGASFDTARADIDFIVTQRVNCIAVHPPHPTADPANLHSTPPELRIWGANIAAAVYAAAEPESVEQFSITGQSGVAVNTPITSEAVMVRGIGYGKSATLTVSGGEVSVNGGAFSSSSQTVHWGDLFETKVQSSASNSTDATATVTITGPLGGGDAKSAMFTVTTISAGTTNVVSAGAGGRFDNGLVRFTDNAFMLETL